MQTLPTKDMGENPFRHPCPKCGVMLDENGWEEPEAAAFSLEPHYCLTRGEKVVQILIGLSLLLFIIILLGNPLH